MNRPLKVRRIGVDETLWQDIYHRLLRISWPRFFAITLLVYLGINAFFAALFWLQPGSIANIPPNSPFLDFAFSVETLSTIGYGNFYPVTSYAHALVTCEAAASLLLTAILTGLVFAKFSRPAARVVFSDNILWTTSNGMPVLSLRMGNVRANRVFEGRAKLTLLRDEVTQEGEKLRRLHDLPLFRSETPLFSLSWTIFHFIDEQSPLHGITLEEMKRLGWEIYVTFIGLDQDIAQYIVAHSTYTADNIVRARKFMDMIHVDHGIRVIDFSKLHEIER